MNELSIFHWLVVLTIILALYFGRNAADVIRDLADQINNFKGGSGSGPSHPLPVTGAVETSRGAANSKESKPVGRSRPSSG